MYINSILYHLLENTQVKEEKPMND